MVQLWTAQPQPAERIRRGQPVHTSLHRAPGADWEGKAQGPEKGQTKTGKPESRLVGPLYTHLRRWWLQSADSCTTKLMWWAGSMRAG
eukprot:365743-Chlamydomonas_euryale.AAC.4